MARIRTIKPELAAHEGMFDAEVETGLPMRFAWCMLFTVADREGRFVWRVRTLKAQILPHDQLDFSRVLDAWLTRGFVRKYRVADEWYGCIPTFTKHQVINNRESPSSLPAFEVAEEVIQSVAGEPTTRAGRVPDASSTREVHAQGEGRKEGKGREGERKEGNSTSPSGDAAALGLHEQIIAVYHELLPELPAVRDWPERRRRKLNARISERVKAGKPADKPEYWRSLFGKVHDSDFLCGRKGDWRCPGLEWLLEPRNFTKVIEGAYTNHESMNGAHHAR